MGASMPHMTCEEEGMGDIGRALPGWRNSASGRLSASRAQTRARDLLDASAKALLGAAVALRNLRRRRD